MSGRFSETAGRNYFVCHFSCSRADFYFQRLVELFVVFRGVHRSFVCSSQRLREREQQEKRLLEKILMEKEQDGYSA